MAKFRSQADKANERIVSIEFDVQQLDSRLQNIEGEIRKLKKLLDYELPLIHRRIDFLESNIIQYRLENESGSSDKNLRDLILKTCEFLRNREDFQNERFPSNDSATKTEESSRL